MASKKPTTVTIDFTTDADRPWVGRFLESQTEDTREYTLRVTVTDAETIAAILEGFRRSSRLERYTMDPVVLMMATEPMDEMHFDPCEPEVWGFRFFVEELRDRWGPEVADAIEPIYERETARYMPKTEAERQSNGQGR